ncbi:MULTISPECIES: hypothetical protein [unclassified Streptomyces]|uniref:hypothetical protein n=1 Tax=unclassified Streptomyces TaxID=2593676 RepID=UPI0035DB3036
MARDFDDATPYRIQDANELISARQRVADERIYVVTTNPRPALAAGVDVPPLALA